MVKVNVVSIIGTSIAMSTDDGKKLFNILFKNIKDSHRIELSFEGIEILISHFLNESIGSLYKEFENWDILDNMIEYKDIDDDDMQLLKMKVIPTAKNHFKEAKRTQKIDISILED